jgi:hypothetical protein
MVEGENGLIPRIRTNSSEIVYDTNKYNTPDVVFEEEYGHKLSELLISPKPP